MECQLCLADKDLRRSHIAPNFFRDFSGMMYPTGKAKGYQPFTAITHTELGKRFERKQHGYWEKKLGMIEHLLCGDCELQLSKYEDYFKRYFYGKSSPIRFAIPLKDDPFFVADYPKFKLFLISLLWRASIAKGAFYEAVKLPSRDQEFLRFMLKYGNPRRDSEYFCAMYRLVPSQELSNIFQKHSISIETSGFAPTHRDFDGFSTYTFVLGGLVLTFCVGAVEVPKIFEHTYIKKSGRFFLSPIEADPFLLNYSKKVIESGNVTYEDVLNDRIARKK